MCIRDREKTLEMAPLGPVVFLDTAGIDDTGGLGGLRAGRSLAAMTRADLALLVTDSPSWGPYERDLAARLKEQEIPFVAVRNKADQSGSMARPQGPVSYTHLDVSKRQGHGRRPDPSPTPYEGLP